MASEFDVYLNMQMIGLFISPVFYGIVIALSTGCLRLLARKRFKDFKRLRLTLGLFDVFMCACSTAALIQDVLWMKKCEIERYLSVSLLSSPDSQAKLISRVRSGNLAFVLAIWGATAFMVWRCVVLGQRIKSRTAREGLNGVFYLLTLLILASGIFHFFSPFQIGTMPSPAILIIITPAVTFILALTVFLHGVMLRSTHKIPHGGRRYSFKTIVLIGVESSYMIVISSTVYGILYFDGTVIGYEVVPRILLPHICAISTLLISHRVAKGNALTTTMSLSSNPSQIARTARALARVRFRDTA